MPNEHRNRATGWKHAKLTGHDNEAKVKELLDTDSEYRISFLNRIGYGKEKVVNTSIGGLHETDVPSVLGKKTKSKTDLKLFCESGKIINVSIKKSLSGQVYLIGAEGFIKLFKEQFSKQIPEDVIRAIHLFWAVAKDAVSIIETYGDKSNSKDYLSQLRHKSLNATTLMRYNECLYQKLRNWFAENIYEISMLSFSMGAASDSSEWSEFVWYINLVDEIKIDTIFNIEYISQMAKVANKTEINYGSKNGGTTIQLPFGFVQWHQKKMQFHHMYKKICTL